MSAQRCLGLSGSLLYFQTTRKEAVFLAVSFHRYIIYILLKINFRLIGPDNVGENKEGQAFGY